MVIRAITSSAAAHQLEWGMQEWVVVWNPTTWQCFIDKQVLNLQSYVLVGRMGSQELQWWDMYSPITKTRFLGWFVCVSFFLFRKAFGDFFLIMIFFLFFSPWVLFLLPLRLTWWYCLCLDTQRRLNDKCQEIFFFRVKLCKGLFCNGVHQNESVLHWGM